VVAITFHEKYRRSTVIEDVKKGVIVEDVDACASSIGAALCHKRIPVNIIEEHSIPRLDHSNMSSISRKGGIR
jgi:hypothetical protein